MCFSLIGEKCDDGNYKNGDGCDLSCHLEKNFYCKGKCY